MVNQEFDASANGGFNSNADPGKLTFDVNGSADALLILLKGDLSVFVSYRQPRICWCWPPWKTVRKNFSVYESGYLWNWASSLYSGSINSTVVDF